MIKKSFLASIGVLLVFAIVFSAFTPSFASFEGIEINDSLKETDRNFYYASVFSNLIDSFPKDLIENEFGQREVVAYPPEYGGAYIDKSNTLHILLTKNANMTTKNNYQETMGNDGDIIFDIADFPLSRLYEIQRTLTGVMQEFNIECTVLNEITNKLEIHLLENAKENGVTEFLINKFDDFDAGCLSFKGPVGLKITALDSPSNALAGSDTDSIFTGGTIGFNAYRSATGQYGMVTAAHVAIDGVALFNAYGTVIGPPSVRQFSGTVDAAFVPFPVGITQSYRISGFSFPYEDCITHYYPNAYIITGMNTEKVGRETGATSGYIISASSVGDLSGITFTDQVVVSNTQEEGDSGGPVVNSLIGPLPPGVTRWRILVGIATFKDASNNGYVSKVENIMNALGITPYYGS